MIKRGLLKNFVARRERRRCPKMEKHASPRRSNERMRTKKGTINAISGSITFGGKTSAAREVYASQISVTASAGKHPIE